MYVCVYERRVLCGKKAGRTEPGASMCIDKQDIIRRMQHLTCMHLVCIPSRARVRTNGGYVLDATRSGTPPLSQNLNLTPPPANSLSIGLRGPRSFLLLFVAIAQRQLAKSSTVDLVTHPHFDQS